MILFYCVFLFIVLDNIIYLKDILSSTIIKQIKRFVQSIENIYIISCKVVLYYILLIETFLFSLEITINILKKGLIKCSP